MAGYIATSKRNDWETPQALFDYCNDTWGPFECDVCATPANAKCSKFYTPQDDALGFDWRGRCWMNPPYGRELRRWVYKAVCEVSWHNAERVVALLPARTDTSWWHCWVIPCSSEIKFLRGRVKFVGAKSSAPFPSAIVVWDRCDRVPTR